MLNVLTFTYLHPEDVNRAAQILTMGREAIDEVSERYVLISHKDNPYTNDCPIHEIPFSDFEDYRFDWPLERLKELKAVHDPESFNKVFPDNIDGIKRKILNTINFAIDKVYKCEKILIVFLSHTKTSPKVQGVPRAIYEVLQENFSIVQSTCGAGAIYQIIIQRRSEDDGNNAC